MSWGGDVGPYGLGFAVAALGWAAWAGGTPLSMAIASLTEARREHIDQQLTQLSVAMRKSPLVARSRSPLVAR